MSDGTKKTTQTHPLDRETQLFNLLTNTSLLLMSMVTEAFSEMFTTLAQEFLHAFSTQLLTNDNEIKNLDELTQNVPQSLKKELISMKQDLATQFKEKKQTLSLLLSDPRFDTGFVIVKDTPYHLPRLTEDLTETQLLSYLALLQANDSSVTTLFQKLLEWMNTLPQPEDKNQQMK
jgi:transcriptional regulator of met regulon